MDKFESGRYTLKRLRDDLNPNGFIVNESGQIFLTRNTTRNTIYIGLALSDDEKVDRNDSPFHDDLPVTRVKIYYPEIKNPQPTYVEAGLKLYDILREQGNVLIEEKGREKTKKNLKVSATNMRIKARKLEILIEKLKRY